MKMTEPNGILGQLHEELHALHLAASNAGLYKEHLDAIDRALGLDGGSYAPSLDDRLKAIRKLKGN